jgi:hypothetical protein
MLATRRAMSSVNLVAAFEQARRAPSFPTTTPTASETPNPPELTLVRPAAAASSIPPASPVANQQPQVNSPRPPTEEVVKRVPEPQRRQQYQCRVSVSFVLRESQEVPFSSSRPDRRHLACDEAVTIVSESSNWIRVKTADGLEGNVAAEFVVR